MQIECFRNVNHKTIGCGRINFQSGASWYVAHVLQRLSMVDAPLDAAMVKVLYAIAKAKRGEND